MPQSLSAVYLHAVFSTKERRPFLRDIGKRTELHAYLGGVSKQLDCPPLVVGGVEDHVHLLARFGRTITQADWIKEVKRVSSGWVKQRDPSSCSDFAWQAGYGVFSVRCGRPTTQGRCQPWWHQGRHQPWALGRSPLGAETGRRR